MRTPLTSVTYARDIPVRVGGGWAEFVSAMQVGYALPEALAIICITPEVRTVSL